MTKIFYIILLCCLPLVSYSQGEGAAPRIFVVGNGDKAKLMLTISPKNYGAYFQYGSIIAWSSNGDTPVQEFNPTNLPTSWMDDWYAGGEFPVHNVTNLKVGKGDPCRLVGYTVYDIKKALASGVALDNKTWRMPTENENVAYVKVYSGWTVRDGIIGRYFCPNSIREFLPAAGFRQKFGGKLEYRGYFGGYMSTSPFVDTAFSANENSYLLIDSKGIMPKYPSSHATGLSVRCVRQ